ncbi:MAG: NAD(P)/FAD-dependent oxidoreductase, partial [Acetobacteraceae bacterium]
MDTATFDVIVIGAGIAGATVAAHLAPERRVAMLEAEEAAGYHSTGRSAAMYVRNYGPPDVRVLTGLSRRCFDSPPPGFTDHPLLTRRGTLLLARAAETAELEAMLKKAEGLREIGMAELASMVPALKSGYAAMAALAEEDADIDVAALHQGFLRRVASCGGVLALGSRALRIERARGLWEVATARGAVLRARVLVNAAGAWGDAVAGIAGVSPLGLTACRRTGVIIDPAPFAPADWPLICDVGNTWYVRPEARTRLMVSPADE